MLSKYRLSDYTTEGYIDCRQCGAGKSALWREIKTLIYSKCSFLWSIYSYHGQFQTTNMTSLIPLGGTMRIGTCQLVWANASPLLPPEHSKSICGMKEPINKWVKKLFDSRPGANMVKGTEIWVFITLSINKKPCEAYQEEEVNGKLGKIQNAGSRAWLYSKGSRVSSKL